MKHQLGNDEKISPTNLDEQKITLQFQSYNQNLDLSILLITLGTIFSSSGTTIAN